MVTLKPFSEQIDFSARVLAESAVINSLRNPDDLGKGHLVEMCIIKLFSVVLNEAWL